MPSLKEIKNRIASVNSTRKITSAMKMVASSKLHRAQVMIENMLPYENMLEYILKSFLAAEVEAKTVYSEARPVKRVAVVVFASNGSLCGGFNANIIRLMTETFEEYKGLGKENIIVYPIGRKVAEKVVKMGYTPAGNFVELADKPNAHDCIEIARNLTQMYAEGKIDKVELIYHHFKSVGSQILTRKTFLPIDVSTVSLENDRDLKSSNLMSAKAQEYLRQHGSRKEKKQENVKPLNDNFIVEPDMCSVLGSLIPRLLNLMMYTALLDSNASEHAARMVAMQTATDNADELLKGLNLAYNKSRQQAITNELLDIMGGSVNK